MKKWKQRLIMLLCAALIAPSLLMALPMFTTQTQAKQAASWQSGYMDVKAVHPTTTAKVIVEQGQNFIIGDWISIYDYSKSTTKTAYEVKGAKYSTSNKKIASVSKKGIVNTKKIGTTKITVKVGGDTLTCTMKVVKKKSLTKKLKNSANANKELAVVRKLADAKVTDKNFDTLFSQAQKINKLCKTDYYYSNLLGKPMKHRYGVICYPKAKSWADQTKGEVAMPQYMTYMRVRGKMATYLNSVKAPTISGKVEVNNDEKIGKLVLDKPLSTAQYLRMIEKAAMYNASYVATYYQSSFSGPGYLMSAQDSYSIDEVFRDSNDIGYYFKVTFAKNSNVITFEYTDTSASVDVGKTLKDAKSALFSKVSIVITETPKTGTTTDDSSKPADSQNTDAKTDVPGPVSRDEN